MSNLAILSFGCMMCVRCRNRCYHEKFYNFVSFLVALYNMVIDAFMNLRVTPSRAGGAPKHAKRMCARNLSRSIPRVLKCFLCRIGTYEEGKNHKIRECTSRVVPTRVIRKKEVRRSTIGPLALSHVVLASNAGPLKSGQQIPLYIYFTDDARVDSYQLPILY